MNAQWSRAVPVYGVPVLNRSLKVMAALVAVALLFTMYREIAGLGPVTGMSDAYGWGIWKTFNVMVLTALGSGAFAIGIAVYVFRREKLHPLMRMSLLTSFLAYAGGLMLLGIDAGLPWNFYWILLPWNWNAHSPLAEVAVCMSVYAMIPLAVENLPPVLERFYYLHPRLRPFAERALHVLHKGFPFIVSLAYLLPMLHQSSLGALMLLAGNRVHPLWQSAMLPVLYVGAACFMGVACVAGTTMLCCMIYRRPLDPVVLDEASRLTAWSIVAWAAVRFIDIAARGHLLTMFAPDVFSLLFWAEMALVLGAAHMLARSVKIRDQRLMFLGYIFAGVGGVIYRFSPTTLAFRPGPDAIYFPATMEIVISLGFVSLAVIGFMVAVKKLAILPGTMTEWNGMIERARATHPETYHALTAAAGRH